MVDVHCHVLHNIDDGSLNLSEAYNLCLSAQENNIDKIILTPHFKDYAEIDSFIETRELRYAELKNELQANNIFIELYFGAEVLISDDIFYTPKEVLKKLTINKGRYILIEFPFFGLSGNRLIKYMREFDGTGMIPIIAHPERYSFFQHDYNLINYIIDETNALFQINADSLSSRGSREEFDLAFQMIKKGIASFIASDAHSYDSRPNDLLRSIRRFPQNINPKYLEFMLNIAPELILANDNLPEVTRGRMSRSFRF